MQVVRLHYFDPEGRHVIVDALGPSIRSCFEETVAEPIPEALTAILRKLDSRMQETTDVSDAIFTQFD